MTINNIFAACLFLKSIQSSYSAVWLSRMGVAGCCLFFAWLGIADFSLSVLV